MAGDVSQATGSLISPPPVTDSVGSPSYPVTRVTQPALPVFTPDGPELSSCLGEGTPFTPPVLPVPAYPSTQFFFKPG